jgi:hypothetical protein
MGPPSPERFVEHAMEFDADKDGKLSREELMKFAQQMPNHQGPGGPGSPGGRGGRGQRPQGPSGAGPGRPEGPREGGGPPERPRRPEAE